MNWYKQEKFASITFSVTDSDKIAAPMSVYDIAYNLGSFLIKNSFTEKFDFQLGDVDMDGLDTEAGTRINWYLQDSQITPNVIESAINAYNKHKVDVELKLTEINFSKSRSDTEGNPLRTARIDVVRNNTLEYEEAPSINVSNSNGFALLKMLQDYGANLNVDYSGQVDIDSLESAISEIENNDYLIQPYTSKDKQTNVRDFGEAIQDASENEGFVTPPEENDTPDGFNVYVQGRSEEQIKRYLDMLKQIIQYIRKSNMPDTRITWA